jgi:hypothetical protein
MNVIVRMTQKIRTSKASSPVFLFSCTILAILLFFAVFADVIVPHDVMQDSYLIGCYPPFGKRAAIALTFKVLMLKEETY